MAIIVTPQKAYPSIFDLSTVTQYLKLDDVTDNAIVGAVIDYVVNYAQNATNTLISQDIYSITISDISNNKINFCWKPISNINSITVNNNILISGTDYNLNNNIIIFAANTTNCIINLNGGYSSLAILPPDIRIAILMHISATYDNRNGNSQAVPYAVNNIYNKIKSLRLTFHG